MTPAPRRRNRRRFGYELLTCARRGHFLVGTDAAELRQDDAGLIREFDGLRWHRCLRCDAWIPQAAPAQPTRHHPPARDEIEPPLRGRPLRDRYVLRLIALDRVIHVVVLAALVTLVLLYAGHRDAWEHEFLRVLRDLQGGVGGTAGSTHGLLGDLRRFLFVSNRHLYETAAVLAGYAVLEGVEAVGLWYARRWAEYLTFIATTLLVPLEVYEITTRPTALKAITLAINLAIVVYLLLAKRLFGARGGEAAERREHDEDSGWRAIDRAAPTLPGAADPAGTPRSAPPGR